MGAAEGWLRVAQGEQRSDAEGLQQGVLRAGRGVAGLNGLAEPRVPCAPGTGPRCNGCLLYRDAAFSVCLCIVHVAHVTRTLVASAGAHARVAHVTHTACLQ